MKKTNSMLIVQTHVDPVNEKKFELLQEKIRNITKNFPGFIEYKFQQAGDESGEWTSIIVFDSIDLLEKWLQSSERQEILSEYKLLGTPQNLHTIYSPYNFWFDKFTTVLWKESLLVLLALYPVTFLLSFPVNILVKVGIPFWAALFCSNAISIIILGYVTLPFIKRLFKWWLRTEESNAITNAIGVFIIFIFYCLILFFAWKISNFFH